MTVLVLAIFAASGQAQSFMTIKPQASDTGVVTPAFVADPGPAKTLVVPAHAVHKPGAKHTFQVIPVAATQPGGPSVFPAKEENKETTIRTELPGSQRLFIRESEAQFWGRYRVELAKQGLTLYIPQDHIVSKEQFRHRAFEMIGKHVEPNYVCHGRLLFEQPNFERRGWNFGILQPALNLGVFYYDAALLPYHLFSDLQLRGETSAGKCLPGDQAPLLLYTERWSTSGFLAQAGFVTGALFLFP